MTQAGAAAVATGGGEEGVQSTATPTLEERVWDTLMHRPEPPSQKNNRENPWAGLPQRLMTQ